jgi:hypothetical protein
MNGSASGLSRKHESGLRLDRRLAAVWLLTSLPAAQAQMSTLLQPGEFHFDEVKAESVADWLALEIAGEHARLFQVALRVEAFAEPGVDYGPSEPGRKRVSTDPPTSAEVLLRHPALHPGKVVIAERSTTSGAAAGGFSEQRWVLGKRVYRLYPGSTCGDDRVACDWVLESAGKRQTLAQLTVGRDAEGRLATGSEHTRVVFAGDLDGDGGLDLLLDVSNHYNALAQLRLFLSSAAGAGDWVGAAGSFSALGD